MKRNPHEKTMVHASLQAAGIPVPVEDPSGIEPDLQVESLKGSRIFDLKMGFECLLNVRISNHSYANLKIELQGHLLEASWELTFQEYPKQHAPGCKAYRMLSGRKVRYKSVLNHRLNDEIAPGPRRREAPGFKRGWENPRRLYTWPTSSAGTDSDGSVWQAVPFDLRMYRRPQRHDVETGSLPPRRWRVVRGLPAGDA